MAEVAISNSLTKLQNTYDAMASAYLPFRSQAWNSVSMQEKLREYNLLVSRGFNQHLFNNNDSILQVIKAKLPNELIDRVFYHLAREVYDRDDLAELCGTKAALECTRLIGNTSMARSLWPNLICGMLQDMEFLFVLPTIETASMIQADSWCYQFAYYPILIRPLLRPLPALQHLQLELPEYSHKASSYIFGEAMQAMIQAFPTLKTCHLEYKVYGLQIAWKDNATLIVDDHLPICHDLQKIINTHLSHLSYILDLYSKLSAKEKVMTFDFKFICGKPTPDWCLEHQITIRGISSLMRKSDFADWIFPALKEENEASASMVEILVHGTRMAAAKIIDDDDTVFYPSDGESVSDDDDNDGVMDNSR